MNKEKFISFLKKEHIFSKFRNNYYSYAPRKKIVHEINLSADTIYSAFIWYPTKEGDAFWRNIHNKWITFYSKNINNE